ncbi:hypothetical protein DPEC_G00076770 [Dallia pectoralis]|uniref:Uncharacterized protein n=1 Tax=Dallia pectoralis TaxID=75939 RepID=A0ACC2H499_DALPE|nr:hypothetical protein DPEC_G00076770 [Dallia pectoralis]
MQGLSGKFKLNLIVILLLSVICVFIFCEYLIYYPAILRCSWPELEGDSEPGMSPLHALFLADTHLLGAMNGHWFDKLRREWQMERAFQTALRLQQPEVVFILGDIFDEGKWSSPKVCTVCGTTPSFVLVNSMAMHGDRCPVCEHVENELYNLSQALNCSMQRHWTRTMRSYCQEDMQKYPPSSSIILQHFPLYRPNDAECTGHDAAPPEVRSQAFHERYDVLSQEASQRLLWWFQPRLILSGHTHSACKVVHGNKHPEISVPSFSWRNRNNPSFILGTFSPTDFQLAKCFLPEESSVVTIYCATAMVLFLLLVTHIHLSKSSMLLAASLMGKNKGL